MPNPPTDYHQTALDLVAELDDYHPAEWRDTEDGGALHCDSRAVEAVEDALRSATEAPLRELEKQLVELRDKPLREVPLANTRRAGFIIALDLVRALLPPPKAEPEEAGDD